MGLLHYTTSLPGGSRHCNSCNATPRCLGVVGSATRAMQCHNAWEPWVVELLQSPGPLARGTGGPAQEAVAAERADLVQWH